MGFFFGSKVMAEVTRRINKKHKFVADGIFYAELNALLSKELAEDGYSGVEVRTAPNKTQIIIKATRTKNVLGEKGRRIQELTAVIEKRFNFKPDQLNLFAERRACYGVIRFIMESDARGCEVIVSGKIRAQRAKAMKFRDGYMIKTGHSVKSYVDSAVRHVLMKQGVLGIKVSIMLPFDPTGKIPGAPKIPQADVVTIIEPKEDVQ